MGVRNEQVIQAEKGRSNSRWLVLTHFPMTTMKLAIYLMSTFDIAAG